MNIINLIVGDWSDDGHGKISTHTFECSHRVEEVQQAYSAALTEEQHQVINTIADDYGDTELTKEHLQVLHDIGYDTFGMEWSNPDESQEVYPPYITEDEFVDLYWFIVQRGNSAIFITPATNTNEIKIGGYGLFD